MVASRVEATHWEDGRVLQWSHARTHLGRPVYRVSNYLVDGLLVDTGPRHTRRRQLDLLRGRRVGFVAVTHDHEDHVGNGGPIASSLGAAVHASPPAARAARARARLPFYRRHTWGEPDAGPLEDLPRRFSTARHTFEVVATPGHTPWDVSIVEPAEGWAFTGDLVLSPRQTITMRQEDLAATAASLERLLPFQPRVLFTGIRVLKDGTRVLEDRLAFIRSLATKAAGLRREGWSDARVRRALLGREPWLHYWSGGEFGRGHFARQLLAYERARA